MRLSQLSLRHCKYRCGRDRRGEVRTDVACGWRVARYGDGLLVVVVVMVGEIEVRWSPKNVFRAIF